jgi:predicted MFS family arabinose efflux permease
VVAIAGIASAGAATPVANAGPPPRADRLGFLLSGTFMVALVFTLQSAPRATVAPASFIAPFAVAAAAFLLLLAAEARAKAPLVDLTFFRHRTFVMGVAIGSLGMFSILSLLLYFNLYAQGRDGPGFTALEAGASLLPLSGVLLAIALSASAIAARIGLRHAMAAGMVLLAIASAIVAVAVEQGWIVILLVGLALIGAGLALPYALAPRLALSALAPAQTGQGSGIVNACTFLSGSAGVACGAIAFAAGGFVAVLTMIALIAIAGAALSYAIAETG